MNIEHDPMLLSKLVYTTAEFLNSKLITLVDNQFD